MDIQFCHPNRPSALAALKMQKTQYTFLKPTPEQSPNPTIVSLAESQPKEEEETVPSKAWTEEVRKKISSVETGA